MAKKLQPVKDRQTVTPKGESIRPVIHGLAIRRLLPQEDERGEIVEMHSADWKIHPAPVSHVYQVLIRPGAIKGWVVHKKQEDRIFTGQGVLRWVFFDNRADSPTYQMLNDFTFSDRHRALMVIPRGVYHAVRNIGYTDAFFVNMPSVPYNYADPDKFRLPIKNDLIPFDFLAPPAW